MLGGQHQAYSARREIVKCSPSVDIDKQSLPRMVQKHRLTFLAVVEGHMKRAAEGNDKLPQPLMCMTSTTLSAWHIIDPIGPFDIERHHRLSLSERQIPTRIRDLRQIDYLNIHQRSAIILTWRKDPYRGPSWPSA